MDIDLQIDLDKDNILNNISSSSMNKLYCQINNDNEKSINLYANILYNFKFNSNSLNSTLNLSKYYIAFFYNFNYNTNTTLDNEEILHEDIIFHRGVNNLLKDTDNHLKSSINFKTYDINYNFTYIVYELEQLDSSSKYKEFLKGKLIINYPLVFIKLIISNNKLIHDSNDNNYESTKYLIDINKNKNIGANNVDIILYEKYNYIFETYDSLNTIFLNIYLNNYTNYNLITENNTKYSLLYIENISNIKKNKYLWSINTSNNSYNGEISFVDINKNNSNDEKIYDYKYKNIEIINKIYYNNFIYKENLNIKNLNNTINNLLVTDSNKLLVINNKNNINISIVLPSNNIYLGLTYNILIKYDLNILNIYCEDNNKTQDNYDKIKGSIFLINSDNLFYKSTLSNTENISETNIETNLSENIIIKKIRLNNGNTYNGGLNSYGYLKLICVEYINNNYVWNIESKLLGDSILYTNTYLYNSFI